MTTNGKGIFGTGKYFVAFNDNTVMPCQSFSEAVKFADEDGIVLIAMNKDSIKNDKKVADKIVLNFDKKLLTITGKSVKLNLVEYDEGDTELEDSELEGWQKLLEDIKKNSKEYSIVGEPPLLKDEKDLTNEMSDL